MKTISPEKPGKVLIRIRFFKTPVILILLLLASFSLRAQLSGTYTICASGCNYSSVSAAVSNLNSQGISGPVTFNVSSGTYNAALSLNSVSGASATNTITFQGAGRGNAIITSSSTTLILNSSRFVTFNGFTITSTSATAVYSYYTTNCGVFNCDINATNSSNSSVYCIYDYYTSNWTVSDCHLSGGYYNIYIYSSAGSSSYANNNYWNNRIVKFYFYGIFAYYTNKAQYTENVIDSSANGYGYGYYSLYESGARFTKNQVVAPGLYYPYLVFYSNYYSNANQTQIVNNFCSNYQYYAYNYMYNSSDVLIAHNTYYASGNYFAFYFYGFNTNSNINIISNIMISRSATNPAAYIYNFTTSNSIIDGNDFVNQGGGNLVQNQNGSYSTLSAYKSAMASYSYTSLYDNSTQKFESHATNLMPTFVNPPKNLRLDPSGNIPNGVYAGVNNDIDGNVRNHAAPVAGAYEYCAEPVFTSCPGNISTGTAANSCDATVSYTSTASGSPSYTYTFTGATNASGSGDGSGSVFNKGVTNVTVTATNTCGSATCSFTVTVNDNIAPVAIAQNFTLNLSNGSGTLSPGDIDYGSYDNCSFTLSLDKTAFSCADAGNNTVTLTATDASGNSSSATAVVTVNAASSASITTGGATTFCNGGSVVLTANTGASYSWSNENGPLLGGSNQSITVSASGTYYVTVINAYGCSATSAGVTVTVNAVPTATASASPTTVYYGYTTAYNTSTLSGSSSISGSGYSWSSSPSGFSSSSSGATVTPSVTTTYSLTVTSPEGCASQPATVTVNVIDVRCGVNNNMVQLCNKCKAICMAPNSVGPFLSSHPNASLGACGACQTFTEESETDRMNIFPNPFTSTTNIELVFARDQQVSISVWAMDGKRVKTIFEGNVTARSQYNYSLDGTTMMPGIYFVKVQSGDHMEVRKIELMH
jgi:hypothetical protein